MRTPRYLLDILVSKMPLLEAEWLSHLATSALTVNMEKDARRRYLDTLANLVDQLRPTPPPPEHQFIEHNPEKAAEWFRQMGVKVVTAS